MVLLRILPRHKFALLAAASSELPQQQPNIRIRQYVSPALPLTLQYFVIPGGQQNSTSASSR